MHTALRPEQAQDMLLCHGMTDTNVSLRCKLLLQTEKVSPVNPQLKRLQKGRSANVAAVNPRGAVRAGQVASPASPSLASQAAQGWSEEQRAALQKAFLTVKPSQPKFWLHVANLVPGKTALQCCNAKFDEMPTPVEKPNPRGKLIPGQEGSPIQAPALKLAAGETIAFVASCCAMLLLFSCPQCKDQDSLKRHVNAACSCMCSKAACCYCCADHSILLSCPNVSTWSCTREPGGDAHGEAAWHVMLCPSCHQGSEQLLMESVNQYHGHASIQCMNKPKNSRVSSSIGCRACEEAHCSRYKAICSPCALAAACTAAGR